MKVAYLATTLNAGSDYRPFLVRNSIMASALQFSTGTGSFLPAPDLSSHARDEPRATPVIRAAARGNFAIPSRLRRAAAASVLAAVLGGCNLMTEVDPLRSGVEFTLTDGYHLNGTAEGLPTPYLTIQTDRQYGCMNYPLVTTVRRSGSTTTVDMEGVRTGGGCLTAVGPALFRTPLGLPVGRSTLVLRGAGAEDTYAITVSDSVIEVSPAAGTMSHTDVPRSWRVPQNTFAARCVLSVATVANPVARCNAFHDSLAVLGGLDRYLFGAAATPPSPPFDTGAAAVNERVYHYASAAALAAADALIRRMARNDSGFYLSVRTWRNESHPSWWPQ